jgi:hypothetical protein
MEEANGLPPYTHALSYALYAADQARFTAHTAFPCPYVSDPRVEKIQSRMMVA